MKRIVIASADAAATRLVASTLDADYGTATAGMETWPATVRDLKPEVVFIDIEFLGVFPASAGEPALRSALDFLRLAGSVREIIVLASVDRTAAALGAIVAGADHFLTLPLHAEDLAFVKEDLKTTLQGKAGIEEPVDRFGKINSLELIHTGNPRMKEVFAKVRAVAPTRSTVLLTGETGTGKGVVARLIHHRSDRRQGPFISLHCGAIPEPLLESELFGHEKGAFTGATRRKFGKFELARGGTLFLDEIGTISAATQIKLLQILQEKRFSRVGGEETIEADVRVIAATNDDLARRCTEGSFRLDLYYRLNVFPIEIPPLRARREDIPILVSIFLKRLNQFGGKDIEGIDPRIMEAFRRYPWPGNIRELENLVERAYILEAGRILGPAGFPADLFSSEADRSSVPVNTDRPLAEARRQALAEFEMQYLVKLLREHRGFLQQVADKAGIGVRQLHKLMSRYHLDKRDFRQNRRHR